jgi:hypothetical protein
MREDFKYPYRIITRKEEIEANEALGFLTFGIILLPFMLLGYLIRKGGITALAILWFVVCFCVFYFFVF